MGRKGLTLEEAPVFHPSEEEFQNALRYIASIREQAEPYGLCRIVPPSSWQPPFALPEGWKFKTKVQKVHHLQERQGGFDSHTWRMEYERFLRQTGRVVSRWPLYAGEELDLCKLYNAVKRHGYLEGVSADRKWPAIARLMRKDGSVEQSPNAGAILRQLYQKYLLAYEIFERDPTHHAHFSADSSSEEEGGDIKPAARRKKGRGSDQLGLSEMDVAEAFLELGTEKVAGGRGKGGSLAAVMEAERRQDQKCQACEGPGHEDKMILCDRCDSGWHIHCLSPPLVEVPPGNWYCPRCVTSEDVFGFEEGTDFTLEEFQQYANRFKRKWLGSDARVKALSPEEIEAEFWRIVEQSKEPVEVLYGSDLDTSIYGSGFPRLGDAKGRGESGAWEEYARSCWNLNNMPRDAASVLNRIDDQIPGVMVPWLYIGMLFSSFCWHYEDHCLYSINYCHWGEPKKWYGVPGSCAAEFEEVMKRSFPDMFAAQPDLLFQLVTMLHPAVLRKHGVPVYTTLQGPREFVITFPRSYHGGFNMGFNCAEAVNFAPADWLPWGGVGVERYRFYHRKAIVSHDQLLRVVAKGLPSVCAEVGAEAAAAVAETQRWVRVELGRVLASERAQREALWLEGTTASMRIPKHTKDDRIGEEEDPECLICKYYLHLSAVVCTCRPGKMACLKHARELCECQQASERSLLYRYSLAELEDLLTTDSPPSPKELERPDTPPLTDLVANSADDGPATTALRRRAMMRQGAVAGPAAEGGEAQPEGRKKRVKGSYHSHAELAFSWAAQARSTLQQRPSLPQVAALLQEADEFLWGGHNVDPVRAVVAQCREVQEWAAELAAVAGSNGRRVALARLQEAGRRSSTAPQVAGHAHLVRTLEERLRKAAAMADKMDKAMTAPGAAPLEVRQAQALLREAEGLPVVLPQAAALRRLVQAAQGWADELRRVLGGGPVSRRRAAGDLPDIDYLGSLLKQGRRQAVRTPEVALLEDAVARVRQWQARARELQAHTGPLKVLQGCLREAEQLPAHAREMDLLAGRVLAAEDWQRRALKALAPETPPQPDESVAPADRAARLRSLRGLLTEGGRLNLEIEEVGLLSQEVRRQTWLEGACRALKEAPTLPHLQHLVQEGESVAGGGPILSQLAALASLAADWEEQAGALLGRRGSLEELAALQRLAEGIPAKLPSLKPVTAAQAAARAWGERAHPYLRSKQSRRHIKGHQPKGPLLQVSELEALVAEAASLAVTLKEADLLATRLAEVTAWRDKARSVLQAGAAAPEAVLGVLVADGEATGLDLSPDLDLLQARAAARDWERRAKEAAGGRQELAVVAELVKEARSLEVDAALVGELRAAVEAGQAWATSARLLLQAGPRDKGSLEDLEQRLEEGRTLPTLLPDLYRQLEHHLQQHRQWEQAVRRVVGASREGHVTRGELERLLAEGEGSVVHSAALGQLREAVAQAVEWEAQLRRALAKKGTSTDVDGSALLQKVAGSLQAAVGQLRGDESGGRLFCACQQVFREAGHMIGCDLCDQWYHVRCVGLTQAGVALIKKYHCPYCIALQTGALPLEQEALNKLRSTRQPALATLQSLHASAAALPCSLASVALLGDVAVLAAEYATLARAALDAARIADPLAAPPKASPLLPLLKSVAVCEVELDGLLASVLAAMAAHSWRAKAARALAGPQRPTPRSLARLLKEAPPGVVAEGGGFLVRLHDMDAAASAWLEQAKQVANDGGAAPVAEVEALIARGRALPVLLDKECQELQERCQLYCTCQKPYDEEAAMIACDRCGAWFHYACVGLEEPQEAEGKTAGREVEVDLDFLCAACMEQVAQKRAAAAERRRKQQEKRAERAKQEEQGSEDGDSKTSADDETACDQQPVFALLAFPAGLKRKRSLTTRKTNEIIVADFDIDNSGGDDEETEDVEEKGTHRPARRTAGFNHKYANGHYVLS